MAEREKILIELGGQQFRIAPPDGNAERLRTAAAYVAEKIATIERAGVAASNRVALLAALEITLELFMMMEKHGPLSEKELRQAQDRLTSVIHRLDEALAQSP